MSTIHFAEIFFSRQCFYTLSLENFIFSSILLHTFRREFLFSSILTHTFPGVFIKTFILYEFEINKYFIENPNFINEGIL